MTINVQKITIANADIVYYQSLFSQEQSNYFFNELLQTIKWQQHPVKLYGKILFESKLSAYYGDKSYRYSGFTREPLPWHPILLEIKSIIESTIEAKFNAVLLNQYRDGNDSIGWHSDNQKDLGLKPTIASVSFGATRRFVFRYKQDHNQKIVLSLADGDLLVMAGETQKFWQHQIPKNTSKTAFKLKPRINLTYRLIV